MSSPNVAQSAQTPQPQGQLPTDRICVAIRVRPLNEREKQHGHQTETWNINEQAQTIASTAMSFPLTSFDSVFNEWSTQQSIYESLVSPLVKTTLDGISSTIFAYGQTSSGKTYTMRGMMHLAMNELFNLAEMQIKLRKFVFKLSFVEIYNEKIKDLLNPTETNLSINEDANRGIFIKNVKEIEVEEEADVSAFLSIGETHRAIGNTAMNDVSSRSHTIFKISIVSSPRKNHPELATYSSTLQLVDLAGSERVAQTNAAGARMKEGIHINKSLLTLASVIRKLSEQCNSINAASHIPFRDSKLTRILQPSLSGNSRVAIICCITPSNAYAEETLSTLRFAMSAKNVTTKAKVNEVLDDAAMIGKLKREIARLTEGKSPCKCDEYKSQVDSLQEELSTMSSHSTQCTQCEEHKSQIETMSVEMANMLAKIADLERRMPTEKTSKQLLKVIMEAIRSGQINVDDLRPSSKSLEGSPSKKRKRIEDCILLPQ